MKKRLPVFVLLFVLCLSVVASAAYVPSDVLETQYEKDVSLLIELGAVNGGEEGLFMPHARLPRSEFATILMNLIGVDAAGGAPGYADVSESHYAADAIKYLSDNGYMNGYGSALFGPDDDMKFHEAVRVMATVLGYEKVAQFYGGYPDGYMQVANEVGLLRGVASDGEYISKGNAAKLICNALETNVVRVAFSNGNVVCEVDDQTMLEAVCRIYKEKGVVTANEEYGIEGEAALEGTVRINGMDFYYENEKDYVGYDVTCYYRIDDDDYNRAICLIPNGSRNKMTTIQAEDIIDAETFTLVYNQGGRDMKLKFSADTTFIYNKKLRTTFETTDLLIENGYLEFLDNDGDGIAEYLKIYECYNIVVDFVDDEKIIDRFDNEQSIIFEDYKKVSIYNTAGFRVGSEYVQRGMVVSVYKSEAAADNIVTMIVSDRTVTGVVQETYEREGTRYAVIGERAYPLYSGYRTFNTTSIALGEEGTYLLDASGKITTVGSVQHSGFYIGILVDARSFEDDEIGDTILRLKIFDQNGTMDYYKAYQKVILDGERYEVQNFAAAAEYMRAVEGKPIRYKLNSSGYLTIVDTEKAGAAESQNNKLTLGSVVTSGARYKSATKIFEGKLAIDENTIVFLLPDSMENAQEEEFRCVGASYFMGDQSYAPLTAYHIEDKIPADILLLRAEASVINNESRAAIVKDIHAGLNADDEEVLMLDVYVNGQEEVWETEASDTARQLYKIDKYARSGDTLSPLTASKQLEKGDLIKCAFNQRNQVIRIALVYDASEKTMVSVNPYHGDFHEKGERYVYGKVENKYDQYIQLDVNNGASKELHQIGVAKIFHVDITRKEILETASVAEIRDEKHNKNGTEIIILAEAGTPKTAYIYQ